MISIRYHIRKKQLRGYLRISITGISPERFINLCALNGIELWDIVAKEKGFELSIDLKNIRRCKPFLRKSGIRLKILKRNGLPFFFYRYRKRKVFFAGAAMFLVFLYVLSLFLWDITIDGNSEYRSSEILSYLEELDIKKGMKKNGIHCEEIEFLLRKKYENIIWTSAEVCGTRLLIHVQEGTGKKEKKKGENAPSDLITEYEGKIISIITRQGEPRVKAGDLVSKGSILVSGNMPLYSDDGEIYSYDYCEADADIMEEIVLKYQDCFSMEYEDFEETGRKNKSILLDVGDKRVILRMFLQNYDSCKEKENFFHFQLGEDFVLPIRIGINQKSETVKIQKKHTKKTAKIEALKHLENFLQNLVDKDGEIVENKVKIFFSGKNCMAEGEIIVHLPVGKRKSSAKAVPFNDERKETLLE